MQTTHEMGAAANPVQPCDYYFYVFKPIPASRRTDVTSVSPCPQVYYRDSTFAMGHVVIRRKRNVVGDEAPDVTLFRCIQNMNPVYPYNTCYTGGEPVSVCHDSVIQQLL